MLATIGSRLPQSNKALSAMPLQGLQPLQVALHSWWSLQLMPVCLLADLKHSPSRTGWSLSQQQ